MNIHDSNSVENYFYNLYSIKKPYSLLIEITMFSKKNYEMYITIFNRYINDTRTKTKINQK